MIDTAKQSIGEEIIEGLTELRDCLRTGEPLSDVFRVRVVNRKDIELADYDDTKDETKETHE